MPELAEVETLRRQLTPLVGAEISSVTVSHARAVRRHDPERMQLLVGATISSVARHGKWLYLATTPGNVLSVHLRMSGRLLLTAPSAPPVPHTHVVCVGHGHTGPFQLGFCDPRTFGECVLSLPDESPPRSRARDALTEPPPAADIAVCLAGTNRSLKALLLDQDSLVSGLGNYLADEVCAAAGADPTAPASLQVGKAAALAEAIPHVVAAAADHRGTSLADEGWSDAFGALGEHGPHLVVHARKHCARCETAIERSKVAGRSTYRCPSCQPSPSSVN